MGIAIGYGQIASRGISPVSLPTLVKVHHSQKVSSGGLALGCPMSRHDFPGSVLLLLRSTRDPGTEKVVSC